MKRSIVCVLAMLLMLTGCMQEGNMGVFPLDGDGMGRLPYLQIDQDQAKIMMEADDGHVIVDVRRQDEFDTGHIPGAICIPNESIGTEPPKELPDRNQIILIYCRSGNRSKQAAEKLGRMGYLNVYEFGGIIDWKGEIVKSGAKATLGFDSFDGGGPEFEIELDPDIVTCTREKKYADSNHEELDGAAFRIIYTFTGITPGETTVTVKARSPIAGNYDYKYFVRVDEELNVSIEERETIDWDEAANAIEPVPTLAIAANGKVFYAHLENNASAQALIEKLSSGAIEVEMHDYGHFEKVGPLPWDLPRTDETITTGPGDVILYQGNQITIYYDQNTWDFTRLAKIEYVTREELLSAFGEGDVKAVLWIEWSE